MADRTINISFDSEGFRLNGVLHLPAHKTPPVVVGSHGLASNGDSPKQIDLAKACNRMGIAYFRFHHRGCGSSEGYFPEVTSLENRKRDLIDAVNAILSRGDTSDRLALFGSSMGGTTCIFASDDVTALGYVLVAAPIYGKSLTKAPERNEDEPQLDEAFYRRFLAFDVSAHLTRLKNILIFHGDTDDIVPVESGKIIYQQAKNPKKLIIQKNGDHRISDPVHQKEFIREASMWFKNCLFPK
ncbi:MAG: alpha/beta hydrolase [Proteobacteria bacterium]|nr:alpha/beta hydrolase [Pseudomonadota bacterium]